jgi:hypothetical protein
VSGQHQAPVALPPKKEPLVTTEYEAAWAPESVWSREKSSAVAVIRNPAVQPVVCRYTDLAIPPPQFPARPIIKKQLSLNLEVQLAACFTRILRAIGTWSCTWCVLL